MLPFNHMDRKPDYVEIHVEKEKAFNKISNRLERLDVTTLLFTRNILKIRWIIKGKEDNDKQGHYLRVDEDEKKFNDRDQVRKTVIKDGKESHFYLVYSRPIEWKGDDHKPVDIAFYIDTHGETDSIQSSKKALFVLFPTTVDTHLGFLMNGSFRTPAHRETVSQDDEFNQFLVKKIGDLLCQSMFDIKEKGFLSINRLRHISGMMN